MTGVPPRRRAALGVTHARIIEKPFELEALVDTVHSMVDGAAAMKIVSGAAGFAAIARPRRGAGSPWPSATSTASTSDTRRCSPRRARARRGGGGPVGGADVHAPPRPAVRARPRAAPDHVAGAAARAARRGGIDVAIVEPFTRAFASIEAAAFVRDVLARDLGARDVVVGYDFSFGRGRAGDTRLLAELGAAAGLGVAVIPPVVVDGVPCSSTRIRRARGARARRRRRLGCSAVRSSSKGPSRAALVAAAGSASRPRTSSPKVSSVPKLGIYAARAVVLDGPAGRARCTPQRSASARNPTFAGERR